MKNRLTSAFSTERGIRASTDFFFERLKNLDLHLVISSEFIEYREESMKSREPEKGA